MTEPFVGVSRCGAIGLRRLGGMRAIELRRGRGHGRMDPSWKGVLKYILWDRVWGSMNCGFLIVLKEEK